MGWWGVVGINYYNRFQLYKYIKYKYLLLLTSSNYTISEQRIHFGQNTVNYRNTFKENDESPEKLRYKI